MSDHPAVPRDGTAFEALRAEAFVSLTTFRRTGQAVATAVWAAPHRDDLVVITPRDSGKVKRLRNDPRVELRPCNRSGTVPDGATAASGVAEIVEPGAVFDELHGALRAKYGLQFRLFMLVERLVSRRGVKPRVMLRIRPGSQEPTSSP